MSRVASLILALVKIGLVVSVLGVFFVLSGYLSVRWALSGDVLEVPEVVGLTAEQARTQLEGRGLAVEVAEERLADVQVPEGAVLRQNPPAGSSVKRQRSVRLTLSAGPPARVVPVTVGEVFTRARIQLQQQEVGVAHQIRVNTDEFEEDRVIAQQPAEGAAMTAGEESRPVRLLVSAGSRPRTYVMPQLVGREIDVVRPFLERAGFRLADLEEGRQRGVPAGLVLGQEPSAGYRVNHGATIRLRVSR